MAKVQYLSSDSDVANKNRRRNSPEHNRATSMSSKANRITRKCITLSSKLEKRFKR